MIVAVVSWVVSGCSLGVAVWSVWRCRRAWLATNAAYRAACARVDEALAEGKPLDAVVSDGMKAIADAGKWRSR